uniref:VWFA domain-containing protein n=1 Tax=Sinocyclocheilus rhinocerous TaxID=307959 RepID=A0A673LUL7_9TELE
MDGSWSVGSDDFETAKRWLISVTSGFDVSSHYSQVGVVQYSDTPRLEIPLGLHKTTQDLIKAIEDISYLGGNTQTGRAIKFAVDHVFASSQRSEVKNRIAVVVTDGKSQDDVMDASVESRAQGIKVFAVGVGAEITTSELVTIANKPEGEYVLYAEDYTNIDRIRDAMEQKLCEGKICMRKIIFKVVQMKILGMKIHQKAKKIQGSLVSEAAYLLDKSTDITENTREIFPEGLPPSYVFVSTLRLKGPSSREKLDLWRVLSKDGQIQAAVTLNGLDKSVIFTSTNTVNEGQIVTFDYIRFTAIAYLIASHTHTHTFSLSYTHSTVIIPNPHCPFIRMRVICCMIYSYKKATQSKRLNKRRVKYDTYEECRNRKSEKSEVGSLFSC